MGNKKAREEHVRAVDQLLHQLLWGLHIKKLDAWTSELESIGALGLHVLKIAADNPDVILKEIREELNIPHSTLTSVVNRLEDRGLLKRIISTRDRRSYGLALTSQGRRVQEDHDRLDHELASTMLEGLEEESDRILFIELISKISRHLR